MPSTYTHYYFGELVYRQLNPSIKEIIDRNRCFYDAGQNGPDLLLYHAPLKGSAISKQNTTIHHCSGRDFFSNRHLNKKEPYIAYLYGYLCHFVLDASLHPIIEKKAPSHMVVEREFERYLLEKNGLNPFRYSLTTHLHVDRNLALVMATFVENGTEKEMMKTLRNMKRMYAFTKPSSSLKRHLVYWWMDWVKKPYLKDFVFTKKPLEACRTINMELEQQMLSALYTAIDCLNEFEKGQMDHEIFDEIFG